MIMKIEATVSTYTAGSLITVFVNGSTTPTTYTLTSATTITGLATGATLASPTNVDLVLSTTLPATVPPTVTSIFVEGNGEGGFGHGNQSSNAFGNSSGGSNGHVVQWPGFTRIWFVEARSRPSLTN